MILAVSFILLLVPFLCNGFSTRSWFLSNKLSSERIGYSDLLMCVPTNLKKQGTEAKKSILGSKLKTSQTTQPKKKIAATSDNRNSKLAATLQTEKVKNLTAEKKMIQTDHGVSSSISVSSSSKSVSSVQTDGEAADNNNLDSLIIDESFRTAMKDFRKANAPKKLIRAVADYSESGRLDQNMTVHAFRTLQRMNRYVKQGI